jgi:hypothetical protein
VLSAVLAAAVLFGTSPTGCAATVVRYDTAVPSVPGASLPTYVRSLRDGRVNGSDGLVLWRTGALIAWNEPGTVVARRLDGRGAFRAGASALRFPSVGCWRLTRGSTSVVARVVGTPRKLGCAVTVLRNGSAYARPHASGIRGGWPWLPVAQLTTHGHDGDRNMKIPWWVHTGGGPTLELVGERLDGGGSFRQEFQTAYSHDAPQDELVYPSIVDIPNAGCWLLRLRTGNLAGVLVVRAVDARG